MFCGYCPAWPPLQPVKLVDVVPVQVTTPEAPKAIAFAPELNPDVLATPIVALGSVRRVPGELGRPGVDVRGARRDVLEQAHAAAVAAVDVVRRRSRVRRPAHGDLVGEAGRDRHGRDDAGNLDAPRRAPSRRRSRFPPPGCRRSSPASSDGAGTELALKILPAVTLAVIDEVRHPCSSRCRNTPTPVYRQSVYGCRACDRRRGAVLVLECTTSPSDAPPGVGQ